MHRLWMTYHIPGHDLQQQVMRLLDFANLQQVPQQSLQTLLLRLLSLQA